MYIYTQIYTYTGGQSRGSKLPFNQSENGLGNLSSNGPRPKTGANDPVLIAGQGTMTAAQVLS